MPNQDYASVIISSYLPGNFGAGAMWPGLETSYGAGSEAIKRIREKWLDRTYGTRAPVLDSTKGQESQPAIFSIV